MRQVDLKVVALIPAFNELAHIEAVVRGARAHVATVLVIDDGSRDETAAAAALAGAVVIANPVNRGKGIALRKGFDWAVRHGADLALTLDADGQHDPAEMPNFLAEHARSGADLIIGQRAYTQMPRVRRWANRTGRFLLQLAQEHPRTASRFSYEVEVIARTMGAGFLISWVPIRTIYGDEESHFRPIRDSLDFLHMVWQVWRMRRGIRGRQPG